MLQQLSKKEITKRRQLIYALRKETKNSGEVNYIPVCANKPLIKYITPQFTRIILVDGEYILHDLDLQCILTKTEALSHIEGYKKQLEVRQSNNLATIEIIQVT